MRYVWRLGLHAQARNIKGLESGEDGLGQGPGSGGGVWYGACGVVMVGSGGDGNCSSIIIVKLVEAVAVVGVVVVAAIVVVV